MLLPGSRARPSRWYRSFYWRIAASFVVLVVGVVVGQSLIVSYMVTRRADAFAPANPQAAAAAIAAGLGRALAIDPVQDVDAVLRSLARGPSPSAFVVLKDGRTARHGDGSLSPAIRRQVDAMIEGVPPSPLPGDVPSGPVVTAPIQWDGRLQGFVVLPPPPPRGLFSELRRVLSLPGTLVLLTAAALAAIVIFAPARERLRALEEAADRVAGGDLAARAPERGEDEIARVASAFNRMAAELASRTDALQASNAMRRQMLADVSHELRTPLTAMTGYLDTLAMTDVAIDGETRARYLETVRHETHRLDRIVADLLDLAKFENDPMAFECRVFAIDRVFAHVVQRYEGAASAQGVALTAHVGPGVDQLVADPHRLEQALSNLVANAIRHTPSGGSVSLAASAAGDACRLTVADTGEGIPAAHLSHVFDRFYKVEAARPAGAGGSGLGLSIARAIAERHGGTITVTSRPGRTEFALTLPHQALA